MDSSCFKFLLEKNKLESSAKLRTESLPTQFSKLFTKIKGDLESSRGVYSR